MQRVPISAHVTVLLVMLAATPHDAFAQGGPVLTVDAAARGVFDDNAGRSVDPLEAYTGGGDLLLRMANRIRAPTLQLEYAASLRHSSPVHQTDGTGHRANLLLGLPVAAWLRTELIGRASRGGTDEDLATGDEFTLQTRIDLLPVRSTRLRTYGAYRQRTVPGSEPSTGRYAGLELRQRVANTIFFGDVRLEDFMPADPTRQWDRRAAQAGVGQALSRHVSLEGEVRVRERTYPLRLLQENADITRRDTDERYGLSLVFDNGTGTEIRLEAEREVRRSNDPGRAWAANRAGLMIRQRLFAIGGRNDPPRIDERPSDAIRTARGTPTPLRALRDVNVAGTSLCALGEDAALCWPGRDVPQAASTDVHIPGRWTGMDAAAGRACGIDEAGLLHCWNWGGDSRGSGPSAPRIVHAARRFSAVAVGSNHACGLSPEGAAFCWGANNEGQLGTGLATPSDTPVAVVGDLRFRAIAAGERHTCALGMSGELYCWGANDAGQSALGSRRSPRPRKIAAPAFRMISAGARHTCALTNDGIAYCWGESGRGQSGARGGTLNVPTAISSDVRWASIAAGWAHTCALSTTGAAYCWGGNQHGQLGAGAVDGDVHHAPQPVTGGGSFVSLSASFRTCALDSDGHVHCWGGAGVDPGSDRRDARPRRVPLVAGR
jgi:alpha-tubulin suppressor-like RCC1 family protein